MQTKPTHSDKKYEYQSKGRKLCFCQLICHKCITYSLPRILLIRGHCVRYSINNCYVVDSSVCTYIFVCILCQGYNYFREWCGLKRGKTFRDLTELPINVIKRFQLLYECAFFMSRINVYSVVFYILLCVWRKVNCILLKIIYINNLFYFIFTEYMHN